MEDCRWGDHPGFTDGPCVTQSRYNRGTEGPESRVGDIYGEDKEALSHGVGWSLVKS